MAKFNEEPETMLRGNKENSTTESTTGSGTFDKTISNTTTQTGTGVASNSSQSKFFSGGGETKTSNEVNSDDKKPDEEKENPGKPTIELSRGILQFISEGDFSSGNISVRKPHFPGDVHVFQKLTQLEKDTYDKAVKKPFTRYAGPNDNNKFIAGDDAGDYKLVSTELLYTNSTYTANYGTDKVLGTTTNSGATIGFGVDMGTRYDSQSEAKADLISAGILDANGKSTGGSKKAERLLEAAGLKSIKGAEKASELRNDGVEITNEQALKLLDVVMPSYDNFYASKKRPYKRGDGQFHQAIEEVFMNLPYWGVQSYWNNIYDAAVGKTGLEQLKAARDEAKKFKGKKPKFYEFLNIVVEMTEAGNEVKFSSGVKTLDELKADSEKTFETVMDVNERMKNYGQGKNLKAQVTDSDGYMIEDEVGEIWKDKKYIPATNNEADVKVIQQLLYNGNFNVEVTGKYFEDEEKDLSKTRDALTEFLNREKQNKFDGVVSPSGATLRRLKKYKYKVRDI